MTRRGNSILLLLLLYWVGDVTWTPTKTVHLAWNTESGYTASSSKELEGFNVEMSGGVKCSQCFFYASGNYGGTVNIDKRELVSAFIGFTNSEVVASLGVQASGEKPTKKKEEFSFPSTDVSGS